MDERAAGWRRFVPGTPEEEIAQPKRELETQVTTRDAALISQGVEMNGQLKVPHSLRIEGEFRGQLESGGSVFVSDTGAVEAPIRAKAVEIYGAVAGDITASREVVIHPTGRLHGNVETPSLVVMRGAFFNGQTHMYRPEKAVQASAAAQPSAPAPSAPAPAPETRA